MLSAFYNYLFIFLVLFFLTRKITLKYYGLNDKEFTLSFFYHVSFTLIYIVLFNDKPADYRSYIELKHIKPFHFPGSLVSTELIYYFIKFFKSFFYFNNLNIIFLFSSISYFGILIFIKNLTIIGVDKKIATLIFFIPGIHFWTSIPGKDCFILFFLSCFFYMYMNKKFLISLVFILFVILIRPQVGVIFLISIGLTEFYFVKGVKKLLVLITTLVVFYLVLNSSLTGGYLVSKNIFSDNLIYQMLGKINELSIKFNSLNSSYEINNLYFYIFNYLIFPIDFIFKENSLFINLAIFLEILSLIFVLNLLINHNNHVIVDKKLVYFLATLALIYLMILPQALFNFGINIRQKWMIIPFLIYLSFLLKNLLVKINKT